MINILCYHGGGIQLQFRKESKKTRNTGLWCTIDKQIALSYSNNDGYLSRLQLEVNPERLCEIDCKGKGWNKIYKDKTSDDLVRLLRENNPYIDLIALHNCIDFGGKINCQMDKTYNIKKPSTSYCIINQDIIKKIDELPIIQVTNSFSELAKRLVNINDSKF